MIRKIYLATMHDHHYDDTHIAFAKSQDAISHCKEWIENHSYGKQFEEEDIFIFFSHYMESCYWAKVEEIEFRGSTK